MRDLPSKIGFPMSDSSSCVKFQPNHQPMMISTQWQSFCLAMHFQVFLWSSSARSRYLTSINYCRCSQCGSTNILMSYARLHFVYLCTVYCRMSDKFISHLAATCGILMRMMIFCPVLIYLLFIRTRPKLTSELISLLEAVNSSYTGTSNVFLHGSSRGQKQGLSFYLQLVFPITKRCRHVD